MQKTTCVSLCMIVRDEERFIRQCLESVKEIVDEMIVVDTGSVDGTVGIAEGLGASVYYYAWNNSFSDARNFAIGKAAGDWLLLMDADEQFEKADREKFFELLSAPEVDGYYFTMLNYAGKGERGRYTMHSALRLLRNNGNYRFAGEIHEQIVRIDQTPVLHNAFIKSDVRLHHYGYLEEVIREKKKGQRNLPMLLRAVEQEPHNAFYRFNLANEYVAAEAYEPALEAYEKAYAAMDPAMAYAPHLVYRRAMTYGLLGRNREAIAAAAEGLAVFPAFTDLEFLRGMTYCRWGRYTLAIESFTRCIQMGDAPRALQLFEGGATTRPYTWLGNVYARFYDYEKAAGFYQKALLADPTQRRNLYNLGDCLGKLYQDKTKTADAIRKLFADTTYFPNQIVLADLLICQQLYEEAAHILKTMKEKEEYEKDHKFITAKLYFYTGRHEEARGLFESLFSGGTQGGVLQNISGESAEYLFLLHLISKSEEAEKCFGYIETFCGKGMLLLCRQILSLMEGTAEPMTLKSEDWKEVKSGFARLLLKLLDGRERSLFEKLLRVLDYVDTSDVLVFLGSVYHTGGYDDLAVQQAIRSVREFGYIDEAGVELLMLAYRK